MRDGARSLSLYKRGMPSSEQALFEATMKRADKLQAKGKPADFKELVRLEPDGGTINIRNTSSRHRARWLGPESRCLVPFTSFSESEVLPSGVGPPVWFALDEYAGRPSPSGDRAARGSREMLPRHRS